MSTKKKTQKKAQVKEVESVLPKNPAEYSYRGDELIPIPASVFLAVYKAIDKALKQGIKLSYPTSLTWVSVATGMPVVNPKEADIVEGRVRQTISLENTFSHSNLKEEFEEWLFPEVIQAKDALINIHNKAVEDGIATKLTDLQAEAKAKFEAESKVEPSGEEQPESTTPEK